MGVLTFGALLYLGRRAYGWLRTRQPGLPQWKATSHEKDDDDDKMRPRRSHRRKPERLFKLFLVVFIVGFYYVWASYVDPPTPFVRTSPRTVQYAAWKTTPANDSSSQAKYVKEAVRHSFTGYKNRAFGYDDVDPLTGQERGERGVKAAYLIEAIPVLALMGMWEEFGPSLRHLVEVVEFSNMKGLVDPAELTSRYLGALVSLLEMAEAGVIPEQEFSKEQNRAVLGKAEELAKKLLSAFGSKTGLPYPRIDGKTGEGVGKQQTHQGERLHAEEYAVEPDHVAAMLLENVALSRLLSVNDYRQAAEKAWSGLNSVKLSGPASTRGLLAGPIDILSGPTIAGQERHWDAGHGVYYATLLDSVMLGISSTISSPQHSSFNASANALRWNVTSKSSPTDTHLTQHLYIGRFDARYYFNEQSQYACSAASTLLLGGAYLQVNSFTILGQALMEGCHHVFNSTPVRIGAEKWSWTGTSLSPNGTYTPTTKRSRAEVEARGFWTVDPSFTWNPSYFQSLFYAWRVTGEKRYREWAWDAFRALQRECKTQYGYAGLKDVMDAAVKGEPTKKGEAARKWTDEVSGGDVLQCFRWLWLIFSDTEIGSLDKWVFTSSGNMLKRG